MSNNKNFTNLVEKCLEKQQFVGLGEPNAKILFIGKEAGFDANIKERKDDYNINASIWRDGNLIYSKPYQPEEKNIKNGNHTWQKYQKLYNMIAKNNSEINPDYYIDFVANVFTTELSNIPYPKTNDAKKDINFKKELKERKEEFWKTDFIREFPIVIITALDKNYISNHGEGEEREIDAIFKVAFEKEISCSNSNDKFWIHYSTIENKPKLVIHTRQLTNGASVELLELIAKEVKEFISENSINMNFEKFKM